MGGSTERVVQRDAVKALSTYGHVIDELDDAPRIAAEDAIMAARWARNFLSCDRDQELLLAPSLRGWLPEGHLAWFVLGAVASWNR
jgi:hypothetical protein